MRFLLSNGNKLNKIIQEKINTKTWYHIFCLPKTFNMKCKVKYA